MKYMGSKNRIASDISQYINDIAFNENIENYYEPFMGGCSVGEIVNVKNRYLSDINEDIVELFKKAQTDLWEYQYIDRDTWYKIKDDRYKNEKYPKWLVGWCGVACSFRGRVFEGYAGKYIDAVSGAEVNPQQQVYNSLVKEVGLLKGIQFSCRRYWEIGDVQGAIIYCDAPYRNVKQYKVGEKFDFDKYDEWLINMSKNNLVLISEYSMVGIHTDKFIELNKWTLNKSIGAGKTDDETSVERLFYVKNGWLTDKYFESTVDEFDF